MSNSDNVEDRKYLVQSITVIDKNFKMVIYKKR
jgi:hypothetical protein